MPKRSFHAPQRNRDPGRTRSRKPFLLVLVALLAGLLWFAPTIVVNSPLKSRILAAATSDFQGSISVGSISAGWFSKPSAANIVATDTQGERLLEVAAVRLDKNLIALLRDHADLGTIHIQQPVVNLVLRPDGSNLEDAIAKWLVPSDEPSSIGCHLEIDDGVLHVTDAARGAQWTATKLNVGVSMPRESTSPLAVHVATQLNPASGTPGTLSADLIWQRGEAAAGGKLSVQATAVPLELATPGLQRALPDTMVAGLLSGDISLDWGAASSSARIGQLTLQNLLVSAPEWLGADRIELTSLSARGEVTQRGEVWQAQDLQLSSDLGQVTATGTAAVSLSDREIAAAALLDALRHSRFQVDGQIDLARVARMLPNTLKIREGTHVATGDITLALASEIGTSGQSWSGRIEAKDLAAMVEGRRVTWDQPIVIMAEARDVNGLVTFDKLACESSFLNVVASGTSAQGAATLRGDFARLAAELNQFMDLGDLRVAGRMDGQVDWQTASDQRLRLAGAVTAEQFELVSANRPPWREQQLVVQFNGIAGLAASKSRTVDEGLLRVVSGQDQLHLTLLPTPAGTMRETTLPVELQLKGELRNWMARLQPVFVLPGWEINGTIDMQAKADVAAERVDLGEAKIQLADLRASNGSVFINEPVVKIDTRAVVDRATGAVNSPDTTFASSSIALRATNLEIRTEAAGTQIAGDIDYRGDIGKLAAILADPRQPAVRQVGGQATGHARLRHDGRVTSCEWSGDVSDFAYAVPATAPSTPATSVSTAAAGRWNTLWQEPKLKLSATAAYDGAKDTVDITRMEAAGDTISFAARGRLSELSSRCATEIDGQLAYDLQKLAARFRPQLGNEFQIAGRDTRPFSFRGPLLSSTAPALPDGLHPVSTGATQPSTASLESALVQMIAQASLGWSSASVQGVAIGAGEVDAKLADGRLVIAPMDLSVSEGNLHLAPTLLLDRSPMVVTLAPGPLAQRVRISPQMCTSWLKYLAPLVADATAAEGSFSVALDQAVVPLDTPMAGQVEGVLEIHTAQIGPGPLSQQLLLLAAQIKAIADGNLLGGPPAPSQRWLDLPAQRIGFRMAEERVYHQGLQMAVKDVVIRTSGSVGTDQTIAMVAEVPIRDEWLSKSQYLAALRGQTIQVPIRGTLTNPKLDQSALAQITQQTVTGTANRYLQEGVNRLDGELNKQLNRGLEKLFGTPR